MTLGETTSTIGTTIAAVGLFLNWWQLRLNGLLKRAEYIVGLFSQYLHDPDTADIFYRLEYGKFSYSSATHGTPDEIKLDKLLTTYERIATLYEMGTFTFEDLEFMEYEFLAIYDNASIQKYFEFLDGWYQRRGIPGGSFPSFRHVAKIIKDKRTKRA